MRARERKGEVRFFSDGTLAAVGKPLIRFTWPPAPLVEPPSPERAGKEAVGVLLGRTPAPPVPVEEGDCGEARFFESVSLKRIKFEGEGERRDSPASKLAGHPLAAAKSDHGSHLRHHHHYLRNSNAGNGGNRNINEPFREAGETAKQLMFKLEEERDRKASSLQPPAPPPSVCQTRSQIQRDVSARKRMPQEEEEEGAQPEAQKRRPRTHLSRQQIQVMQACFKLCRTPTAQECQVLASELGLPLKVVQIWFQNCRAREKRLATSPVPTQQNQGGRVGLWSEEKGKGEASWSECQLCDFHFGDRTSVSRGHLFSREHLRRLKQAEAGQPCPQDPSRPPPTPLRNSKGTRSLPVPAPNLCLAVSKGDFVLP
ncbi:UNVERIFIED_CONTAM: hypothetical protein FKN15_011033 [Acipenser sinensis]